MQIRPEVFPFVVASVATGLLILAGLRWRCKSWQRATCYGAVAASILSGYFVFFFRDPPRVPPAESGLIVSGADGVGPVCRRVVYWPDHEKPQRVDQGERIGMMKFGSRLDMLFPKNKVHVIVAPGQRVRAGETVVAVTGHHDKGTE